MKILLVEDNRLLAKSLIKGLQQHNCTVEHFIRGDDAEHFFYMHHASFDVIILDRMLPGKSGDELCENIRNADIHTPIIMMTAKDTTQNIVEGLDMGADDYIAKPFEFEELMARLHALTRRKPVIQKEIISFTPDIFLDSQKKAVFHNGREVDLSPKEFSILEVLAHNAGIALTRDQIFEKVSDFAADNWSNSIDVHIKNIRKKLFKNGKDPIVTVRGVGYRLDIVQ